MANLSDRYPLVGVLGSVVPDIATLPATEALPLFGTVAMQPQAGDAPFVRADVRLQPATSLELMALVRWAALHCPQLHLRAPETDTGRQILAIMTLSVHSFQRTAASTATFASGSEVLISALAGCVLAVGSDADVAAWYAALPASPALTLLTLSTAAWRLMATPGASSLPQAPRLLFPTSAAERWNATLSGPEPSDAWRYGYALGSVAVSALQHSSYAARSYTTPPELLEAWYTVRLMSVGDLLAGPYYDAACTATQQTECECAEGMRTVAVRSVASSVPQDLYSITTCRVVYTPLAEGTGGSNGVPVVIGVVFGVLGVAVAAAALAYRLTRRSHAAAPKDPGRPFCVLFTDIQASTHLWAVAPDVMATALTAHHALIRTLIGRHHCYEVKTIGDSFMCASCSPHQAVQLALAIQTTLHGHDWGTNALDVAYYDLLDREEVGQVPKACWNGLRVRIGIHYGMGDIQLDPVTKSYDYYGTVVNTAARIESVCHGGQTGVSPAVHDAVVADLRDVVWADLGCHRLRGLAEPVRLYQALPAGPLEARAFPPLRLHKQDSAERDGSELEVGLSLPFTQLAMKPNAVAPHPSADGTAESWRWVETHPLVLRGDLSAEELRKYFGLIHATLSTLVATQAERAREQMLHGLCERLHVPQHGAHGAPLHRTLQGLVHRVLPATVANARQQWQREGLTRDNSTESWPTAPLG